MLSDTAILLLLATGMTYVIVTAGIDLSVGGVLVFAGVCASKAMDATGGSSTFSLLFGALAAIVAGGAWGILNGVLVAYARVPALIVTLGTLGMSLGGALLITDGVDLRAPSNLNLGLGLDKLAGVPYIVWIAAAITVLLGLYLAQCRFGRLTYAIGSNAHAARRSGVRVERHLVKVYCLAGLLAGLAGYQPLRRLRDRARHGDRRLHPHRPAERLPDPGCEALLAAGRGRGRAHRGRLLRPVAPSGAPVVPHPLQEEKCAR
jgi:ribose transport system permease protein